MTVTAEINTQAGSITALHVSAFYGKQRRVQSLLDKGANANVQNGDGDTPLHWAAKAGHPSVTRTLVTKGKASLGAKNNYGQTPYDVAKQFKRIKVVHLFDDIAGASGAPSTGKKSPVKPAKPTTTGQTAKQPSASASKANAPSAGGVASSGKSSSAGAKSQGGDEFKNAAVDFKAAVEAIHRAITKQLGDKNNYTTDSPGIFKSLKGKTSIPQELQKISGVKSGKIKGTHVLSFFAQHKDISGISTAQVKAAFQ